MRGKIISFSNFYTFTIAVLMLLMITEILIVRASLLISNDVSFLTDWKILFILGLVLFLGTFKIGKLKSINKIEFTIILITIATISLQALIIIVQTDIKPKEVIGDILLRYYWIYLIGLIILFKVKKINIRFFLIITICFIFLNALIGIFQFIYRDPLVQTMYMSEPISFAIYYLNGTSSSYEWLYHLGAQVRAFGLLNSGLTLGILSVFAISILFSTIHQQINKKINNNPNVFFYSLLIIFFLVTIYMTLTRNAYLTCAILVMYYGILVFIKKHRYLTLKITFIIFYLTSLGYVSFSKYIYIVLNKIFPTHNFNSFNSRIDTYNRVSELYNNNLINALYGKGITPSKEWIIDNDMLSIVGHVGLLSFTFMQIIFIWIIFRGLNFIEKNNNHPHHFRVQGLTLFLMTYPIAATLNYVSYIYFWVALVTCFIIFSEEYRPNYRKKILIVHSMNLNNMIPFIDYFKRENSNKTIKLVLIESSNNKNWVTKIKKVYFMYFRTFDAIISDYPSRLLERSQIISIAMGHGTAIKKFPSDKELVDEKTLRLCQSVKKANYYITTSERQNSLEFRNPLLDKISKNKYLPLGLPKNDYYFSSQKVAKINKKIRGEMSVSLNDYLILYAPTFRDLELNSTPLNENDLVSINELLRLNNAFLLYRPHSLGGTINEELLKKLNLSRILLSSGFNFSSYETLCTADALISDYSSITIEYLPLNRPIISYIFDEGEYKKMRGIDFDFYNENISPGVAVKESKDLLNALDLLFQGHFDSEKWKHRRKKCLETHYKYPDGNSSARIWSLIEGSLSFRGEK
ncbi:CDP-glycerol glycerophosphotransferase family protein [Fictibacillus norfolkensis]|uniref:CDP-glycerol glycerophosphotransferase family protein n=1 Tax=Fictibacillus norfolkensis TaxID=2762233 RepID=A0ABR8SIC2_9BACL|nr:CDP-glycerol glycerophosphotransferase family protein [Fictibacillus norfolkensis]MBD7963180.1 CDP-glycerol glycerophosphotransferase family protein [Fictibacillus norfolkensis]